MLGGPGGSGIEFLLRQGQQIQQIADFSADVQSVPAETITVLAKYYDIIGFDPRGVNNTTPALACFPNAFERLAWNLQSQAEGLIGLTNDSFLKAWARAKVLGQSCEEANGQKLGYFLNTTPVVRDMVAIIERHGEWRERQARRWLATNMAQKYTPRIMTVGDSYSKRSILERTRWTPGREKLLYWGFSYGTVIGTTFATMYPDRVHRVILDGVADVVDYYNSSSRSSIQDSDKALDRLLQACFESGTVNECGLFDSRGSEHIKNKLFSVINTAKEYPIPIAPTDIHGPQIITASDIDWALHLAIYKPLGSAEQLFHAMNNLTLGDTSWFAEFKREMMKSSISDPPESCRYAPPWTPECQTSGTFDETGGLAIECSDGESIQDWSQDTFKQYWQLLDSHSKVMGTRKAASKLMCTHWRMRPAWRVTGKLNSHLDLRPY
jgi:pimeloyl-ACP methyl ester carboxylesterase